ncbi:MAG: isocitrate lyase/PEP mutase family protein [Alphaproteobacteria bacterium]|nr:isocitrate lyase/PEP mutase family protein [Alphaproteobacteria bacterium]
MPPSKTGPAPPESVPSMSTSSLAKSKRAALAGRLQIGSFVVAPGVFDMISARIADRLGFNALYMTGYGTVASHLGLPDAGLASYRDMVDRARMIAEGTNTPLIADADTGYGGPLNVAHTVRGYETAGVSALQIEDQEFPKRCGHTLGRKVVSMADMVRKIQVASDSRTYADFLIIARTDARTSLGLDEALRRGEAYQRAGADILFIESPESEAEMAEIGRRFDVPLMANMVEGGRTPVVSADRLKQLGYRVAIFPAFGFLAAGAALRAAYGKLKRDGSSVGFDRELYGFEDFNELMGFERIWEFDRTYGEDDE